MTRRIDDIEARANAATPGKWSRGIKDDPEAGRAFVLAALDKGAGAVHMVISQDGEKPLHEECLVPALTGNGPTSEANATFIAHAREDVPYLVARLKRAEELLLGMITPGDATHFADTLTAVTDFLAGDA